MNEKQFNALLAKIKKKSDAAHAKLDKARKEGKDMGPAHREAFKYDNLESSARQRHARGDSLDFILKALK